MEATEITGIQLSVGEHGGEHDLEIVPLGLLVDDLDLLDQPIEAQPHRGIGNPVIGGHLLQRTGVQQESLYEGQILVGEMFQPCLPV